MTAKFDWKCIDESSDNVVPRSSHDLCAIDRKVYLFGGEHIARTPIDSKLHVLDIDEAKPQWREVEIKSGTPPAPR